MLLENGSTLYVVLKGYFKRLNYLVRVQHLTE